MPKSANDYIDHRVYGETTHPNLPLDTAAKLLEPYGSTCCGTKCKKGIREGRLAHKFRALDGCVPGHEDCPKFRDLARRRQARTELLGMAQDAHKRLAPCFPPAHNGKTSKRQSLFATVGAIAQGNAFIAGTVFATCLEPDIPSRPQTDAPTGISQSDINAKSAAHSVAENCLGRANRQLNQQPRFHVTADTLGLVQDEFPAGEAFAGGDLDELVHLPRRLQLKEVRELIHSKPRNSAPGPSNMGYKFFKKLIGDKTYGEAWILAILVISQAILDGMFINTPAEPLIAASVLTLVSKGEGRGFRPIAIGEVLANIGRSIVARHHAKEFSKAFPLELGNGTTGGLEAFVAGIDLHLNANPTDVSLMLDCSNAFGNIQRPAILASLRVHAPELIAPFRAMYARPSLAHVPLRDGTSRVITISRGVRQGDSLGPGLFILGLLPALEACRSAFPLIVIRSFYDDINLTGPAKEVLNAYRFLLELLRRIGLRLNPAKSKLLAPETIPEPTATDFADAGIPAAQTSMELLGTAIGDAAGIHEFLDSKELEYGKAIATLDHALAKRFSRQVLFKLHRFCAAARNVHLFRTISPRLTEPFAQRLKTRTTEMFYRNCRGFSDPHREVDVPVEHPMCQALLYAPLHLGGLAMPDPTVLRHSAWVSSVRKTAKVLAPNLHVEEMQQYLDRFPQVEASCIAIAALTNNTTDVSSIRDLVLEGSNNLGSHLSTLIHTSNVEERMDGLPTLAKIFNRSSRLPEAGSPFLLAHEHSSRMNDRTFILAALGRLLYPIHAGRTTCPLCKLDADETVTHDLVCQKSLEKRVSNRHQGVQTTIIDCIRGTTAIDKAIWKLDTAQPNYSDYMDPKGPLLAADAAPIPEAPPAAHDGAALAPAIVRPHKDAASDAHRISHPDFKVMRSRPDDLTEGENILIDVTVAGPNVQNRVAASRTSGAMALRAEERKDAEVAKRWHLRPGTRMIGFAVEFTGAWGVKARNIVHEMLNIPPPPANGTPEQVAEQVRAERNVKLLALWRFKAAVTASVWRGNHYIYTEYIRSLQGSDIPGHDQVG